MRLLLACLPVIGIVIFNSYLGFFYGAWLIENPVVGLLWILYCVVSGYSVTASTLQWYYNKNFTN